MIRIVLYLFLFVSICFWSCTTEIRKQLEPSSVLYSEERLIAEYSNGQRDFRRISIAGAELRSVKLHNVNLSDADLRGADLSYANLVNAVLRNAVLIGANLSYADLRFTRTNGIILTGAIGITSGTFRYARP